MADSVSVSMMRLDLLDWGNFVSVLYLFAKKHNLKLIDSKFFACVVDFLYRIYICLIKSIQNKRLEGLSLCKLCLIISDKIHVNGSI